MNIILKKTAYRFKILSKFGRKFSRIYSEVNWKSVVGILIGLFILTLVMIKSVQTINQWNEKYQGIREETELLAQAEAEKSLKQQELEQLENNEQIRIKAREKNYIKDGEKLYSIIDDPTFYKVVEEEKAEAYVPPKGFEEWISLISN